MRRCMFRSSPESGRESKAENTDRLTSDVNGRHLICTWIRLMMEMLTGGCSCPRDADLCKLHQL